MPNSSGYIDFNQYADLNQDEESRLMEEAMQRAEAADLAASQGLQRSYHEAGGQPLSQTGSYSDYLKKKQDAARAWAAVNSRGGDPRSASLRGPRRQGADFNAREAEFSSRQEQNRADGAGVAMQNAALAKKQSDAAEAQKQASEDAKTNYLNALTRGAMGRARAGGTQGDYIGGPNPYANSNWAQQQAGWEAQQVKNMGGTSAQQAGVWKAYTGKGRWGQGPNISQNMNREMSPYAPKKDEED